MTAQNAADARFNYWQARCLVLEAGLAPPTESEMWDLANACDTARRTQSWEAVVAWFKARATAVIAGGPAGLTPHD